MYRFRHNMAKNNEIVIGNKGADFVALRFVRREPAWSTVKIDVHSDGLSGSVKWSFSKGERAAFAREIEVLHRDLRGMAQLQPQEPNITLELTGDGKGQGTVLGTVQNLFERKNQLRFEFEIDQTYLEGIARALHDADPV
jgi:hypothetical protein